MPISLGTLEQMLHQLDEKHEAAHRRLRQDLTEMESDVTRLDSLQRADHEAMVILKTVRDVKISLDASRLVILGALTSALTSAACVMLFFLIRSWVGK